MRLLVFVLWALLVAPGLFAGQQTCETRTQSIEQSFSFSPYPGHNQAIVNTILETLARGSGKLRVYTSYHLQVFLRMELYQDTENSMRLLVFADESEIEGDTYYKDFNLSHLLSPDKADFEIMVSGHDQQIVYSEGFKGEETPLQGALWLEIVFPYKGSADDLAVRFSDAIFYYDDRTLDRILQWNESLRSYYAAPAGLEKVRDLIRDLNPGDPENVLLEEFRLCEAEALMGAIDYEPFHHWLDLPNNDPLAFLPAYESLKMQIDSLRDAFNHSIVHIDSLFYHRGMALAKELSLAHGRSHFLSAITYNPFHIPSHLAIAKADRLSGDRVDALDRLESILTLMQPDHTQRRYAHQLTDSVLAMFFDASRMMIAEERFIRSLEILEHARVFCGNVKGFFPCPGELHTLLTKSHMGVYRSFLVVATRALRSDNLGFARTYIQTARNYQENHPDFTQHYEEATDLLFRVFTRYRVLAGMYEMQGDVAEASRYLAEAKEMAESHASLFEYAIHSQSQETLQTGVLNYAAVGMPHQSIDFLWTLKDQGVSSDALAYHQRLAGLEAARYYQGKPGENKKPGELVNELTGDDPWFEVFVRYFLDSW